MKRFEFRLERVLKVKQQRQWLVDLQMKRARAKVEAARAEAAVLQNRMRTEAEALAAKIGTVIDPGVWTAHYEVSRVLSLSIDTAEGKVRQATQEFQQIGALRRQIATEVEALLSLRQRDWEIYRQDLLREQQGQLDEIGLRRWLNGRKMNASEAGV